MAKRRRDERVLMRTPEDVEASLLDVVDNVLNKGVVLNGDLILGVANVDLIYAKLSAVLAALDKITDERIFTPIEAPRSRRKRRPPPGLRRRRLRRRG